MTTNLKFIISYIALFICFFEINAQDYPNLIRLNGDKLHIQGVAFDHKKNCIYSSFTSAFYKSDINGKIIGSVTGINGHLGAITFDAKSRKVYASLEFKNDDIGKNISKTLGQKEIAQSQRGFYIAQIDVDKINRCNVPFEDVVELHRLSEVSEDFEANVLINNSIVSHRYGCSGIDGITIAPPFGNNKEKKERYLYVSYGIYGDTTRIDNDYNIILCYPLGDFKTPIHKYFVHTGNTTYGVQNMAYDEFSNKIYLAVYKGKKPMFQNYSLFALDMNQVPTFEELTNVPYEEAEVEQLTTCDAWHFRWGSTGLNPLGNGYYYISENNIENGYNYSNITLYKFTETSTSPFEKCIIK